MKANQFNFKRIGLLFQRYFTERSRTELIYWSIMVLVFMFIRNSIPAIGGLIFVAGAFYAARFFREIHSSTNGVAYFMIPATQLEKLTVGVAITSVYYFVMMIIAYVTGNLLGTLLNNALASVDFLSSYLELFHHSSLRWELFSVKTYMPVFYQGETIQRSFCYLSTFFRIFLLIQSIYLLGSIYFKRNQAFATFFATYIIQLLLLLLLIIELRMICQGGDCFTSKEDIIQWFRITFTTLDVFMYLLPPFFWVVSYFRLTEKQV